jgi:mono/diheme cytochrome c family protein
MRRLFKALFGLMALGAIGFLVTYFIVLPNLAVSGEPRNLSALQGDPKQGAYLASAGGCIACHTELKKKGKLFAGGPALKTPFGTFYAPNITPDPKHGIGDWTLAQFANALTRGISPDGRHYFPAFPYTSYTGMTNQHLADLKAYLDTVAAVAQPSRPHALTWPFSDRRFVAAWKALYFESRRFQPKPDRPSDWNRGAYLVNVLGHCGECHTQRDPLGGKTGTPLAGNTRGPEGTKVPSIHNLGSAAEPWSKDQLVLGLQVGMKPSGDFMGGDMAQVIAHSTGKLKPEDLSAIASYLLSMR